MPTDVRYKKYTTRHLPGAISENGKWYAEWEECSKLPLNSQEYLVYEFVEPTEALRLQTALHSYARRANVPNTEGWTIKTALRDKRCLGVRRVSVQK